MEEPHFYQTIEKQVVAEFSDRGSKFIGIAFPVTTTNDFKVALNEVKKMHPKASHHCFAYRLGMDGSAYRVADAGEPSGTAGRPILGQIDSKGLTNVLVVVVRYFGGTLLGVPGLINAYKSAASMALQLTPIVKKPILTKYELQFDYTISNDIMRIVKKYGCVLLKQDLQLFCSYEVGVPRQIENECIAALEELRGLSIKKKSDPVS
ncbi:MAG: hypothetical protein RLZZ520_1241 [Bacteroidota bacterium]|jgi:uncharacterized YigZ family protein